MIKRVEHVGIIVRDMDESIRFYESLLGFKERIRVMSHQKELTFLTHHGLPGFEVELIRDLKEGVVYDKNGLVNHLAFVVDDMEGTISYLKQQGVSFVANHPKSGINGRKTIRFKGPNGEQLQLVEERIV